MSEVDLQSAILEALAWVPNVVAWRNNAGARKGGRLRYGLANGAADIIAIVGPAGRFLAIEVKGPKGRLSTQQEEWGSIVEMHGGVYVVAKSVADVMNALRRAREAA